MVQLEFELAYYNVAVQNVSHYATGTSLYHATGTCFFFFFPFGGIGMTSLTIISTFTNFTKIFSNLNKLKEWTKSSSNRVSTWMSQKAIPCFSTGIITDTGTCIKMKLVLWITFLLLNIVTILVKTCWPFFGLLHHCSFHFLVTGKMFAS